MMCRQDYLPFFFVGVRELPLVACTFWHPESFRDWFQRLLVGLCQCVQCGGLFLSFTGGRQNKTPIKFALSCNKTKLFLVSIYHYLICLPIFLHLVQTYSLYVVR